MGYDGRVKSLAFALPCRVVLSSAALLTALAACGDDGTAPDAGDAGTVDADGGLDAAWAPVPPAAPAPPVLVPCPPGWREVPLDGSSDDGLTVCDPWPVTGREDCAAGAAHFPGTAGCASLGPACPDDGTPTDLPPGRPVIHVRAGSAGGAGTLAAPYGTISEASAVALPGSVIAVAAGAYEEEVTLGAGVALVGACVAGTSITSPTPRTDRGVINPAGADVEVRNLSIGPSPRPGLWIVGEGVSAVVTDVAITGTEVVGISVESGARLDADRLTIREVENPSPVTLGRGLNVELGATATVRHLDARRNVEFGVAVLTGGELHLEDSVVAETRAPAPEINGGPGLAVFTGGSLTADRVVVEDNQQAGVLCFDAGSRAELANLVVRRVEPWGGRGTGRGVNVERGASLSCRRCWLAETREIAVGAGEATLVLEDVVIDDVQFDSRGRLGAGAAIQTGAMAAFDRVRISDASEFGIAVGDSEFTANDLAIRRVAPRQSDEWYGRALVFQGGATATIRRFAASLLHEAGVVFAGAGTSVVMDDVAIEGVSSRPDGYLGTGLIVQDGSSAVLSRVRLEDVRQSAVVAIRGGTFNITDLVVREVASQACRESTCSAYPGGHGLGAYGSEITVSRFLIDGVDLCGVHVADGGEFFLEDGMVRGAAIGACVQSDAQDIDGLSRSVEYVDNGSNLEATMLPVPDPIDVSE